MKLLVTGGAGFIGSNFIRYWQREHPGDQIRVLDKLTYAGHKENLTGTDTEFIQGDICDEQVVSQALPGIEIVVHFAAESHVDRSLLSPAQFVQTNIVGTQVLLGLVLQHKIKRFHHVSTDEVFGSLSLPSSQKFTENTCYQPRNLYSASKAASDHLVRAYHHSFGLPVTITNCSNNYGPYQDPEKFIPRMITNLLDGQKVLVYGDGKYVRDWLYVEDHCRAIEAVLTQGKVGETYCVGGQTEETNNLEVTRQVLKILGKSDSDIEFVTDRPGHDRKYAVDWTKIHQELGWEPLHDFSTWLEKTVRWYQENEWWWRPLKPQAESIYPATV